MGYFLSRFMVILRVFEAGVCTMSQLVEKVEKIGQIVSASKNLSGSEGLIKG
jgi:hypothetical protein